MSFSFRVCFRLTGRGSLGSDESSIDFAKEKWQGLNFSSGHHGVSIGETDRFSISGAGFSSAEAAANAAKEVKRALLEHSLKTQRGIDVGQDFSHSFSMSDHFKEAIAKATGSALVIEDHLGVTVFPSDPKPKFIGVAAEGVVLGAATEFVKGLRANIGDGRISSSKSQLAAELYAISHFSPRAPARLLLLVSALEAVLELKPRSPVAIAHIQTLVNATSNSELTEEDKTSLLTTLSYLKNESISGAGRRTAAAALGDSVEYGGTTPAKFFSKIYGVRSKLVTRAP